MIANSRRKMNIGRAFTVLLLVVLGVVFKPQDKSCCRTENSRLSGVFVIDGDTIKAQIKNSPESIRLIGIDAPELSPNERAEKQTAWWGCSVGGVNAAGAKAKAALQKLLESGNIYIELGSEARDQYGRTLAYLFVKDGSSQELINAKMLESGFARRFKVAGNNKYDELLSKAEQRARERHLGLWGRAYECHY